MMDMLSICYSVSLCRVLTCNQRGSPKPEGCTQKDSTYCPYNEGMCCGDRGLQERQTLLSLCWIVLHRMQASDLALDIWKEQKPSDKTVRVEHGIS